MYCSYKPNMMAFAIHKRSHSHELQKDALDCVLSIPGASLADFALFAGTTSGREIDKIAHAGLGLIQSSVVGTPGLAAAIANIELDIAARVPTGDHVTILGVVRAFNIDPNSTEQCLLSVGPKHEGYRVLAQKGVHRIGVVA
jgi:flavin reductase (DIM6/NTAB) family NADH-FMN oxidoreductase RutF